MHICCWSIQFSVYVLGVFSYGACLSLDFESFRLKNPSSSFTELALNSFGVSDEDVDDVCEGESFEDLKEYSSFGSVAGTLFD